MATEVSTTYTKSLNLSITVKEGRVTKVTTWTTGAGVKSTKRHVDVPSEGFTLR